MSFGAVLLLVAVSAITATGGAVIGLALVIRRPLREDIASLRGLVIELEVELTQRLPRSAPKSSGTTGKFPVMRDP